MGQQQMFILLLVVVVTGIAISVGFSLFTDHAAAANRDAIANDLLAYATMAREYQSKPELLGGGNGSMIGFLLPGAHKNSDGAFRIAATAPGGVTIEGIGTELGYDGETPVRVVILASRDSLRVVDLN